MQKTSAGFWSYVHADDEYERGRIVRLRDRLQQSVRFHIGIPFQIFLDKKDIGWGQQWEARITDSLNDALLLFPIITPSYFSSKPCRDEFFAFQERQKKVGRDDLILPIYYLTAEILEGSHENMSSDQIMIAQYFSRHQYEDFRALRTSEETDPSYAKAVERLGQRVNEALKRSRITTADNDRMVSSSAKILKNDAEEAKDLRVGSGQTTDAAPGLVISITVNQMPGRADCTNISDAIARAPGGARIIVHPGHYREKVVIDKPLELVGNGNVEDIVIEASDGEVVTFDTNIGLVRNFTIRQIRISENSQSDPNHYAVWIKQGRLDLEDCDISSKSGTCLAVSNDADPRIRRNRIHGGNRSGITVSNRARGTYESNEVFGNASSGMQVSSAAYPVVRRNRIYGNTQSGLFIYSGGAGIFEENEIFENQYSGVQIDGAKPVVRRNRIYENLQSGIKMTGSGVYEDNEIIGNKHAGVQVGSGGRPVVNRNRIKSNGYEGIWVQKNGGGSFYDNDLTDNEKGPWDIKETKLELLSRERNIEKKS
jgi:parallel beta-helix repeat protein